MSYHQHQHRPQQLQRGNRIAEEARLMEEMLQIQSKIRAQKEKERVLKTSRNEKYSTMFKPITSSLERLKPTIAAAAAPNIAAQKIEKEIKKEDEEMDKQSDGEEEEESEEEEEEGDLYDRVLRAIPEELRSDGVFGLKVNRNNNRVGQIGRYTFQVMNNNRIEFHTADEWPFEAYINNPDLWALLLVKNPNSIHLQLKTLDGEYRRFVSHYKTLVDGLGLADNILTNYHHGVMRRIKYKIIKDLDPKIGQGFLFSVRPPPFAASAATAATADKRIKPSTVVIPSDKKGLLRELVKAVAELRAGNTSMRNLVVPLAQEAKRKRILPRNLLSADEKTWVFA